jgi:WD40-like Beta Propeller Repeat
VTDFLLVSEVMTQPIIAPYGSWKSPMTSDLIVSEVVGLSQPTIDGDSVLWIEMRPSEGGRNVIVRRDANGLVSDINPPPFNARTRVHEYGGGDYVAWQGKVYFSNFADQQLYLVLDGAAPRRITSTGYMRYADAVYDPARNRLVCVREEHFASGSEARNTIVSIDLNSREESSAQVLTAGHDFYSTPRLSPDGSILAWLTWDHPNMPWDGTELWLADVQADGTLGEARLVAGGASESIFQPEWSPDGSLYFASDRSAWWNLYRLGDGGAVKPVVLRNAEFAMPQWVWHVLIRLRIGGVDLLQLHRAGHCKSCKG